MATLQSVRRSPGTFADLADLVLNHMLMLVGTSSQIDLVSDTYPAIFIKNAEHGSRASGGGDLLVKVLIGIQPCPVQWSKLMPLGQNKVELIEFLAKEWANLRFAEKMHGHTLYVTHEAESPKMFVTEDGLQCEEVP